MAITVMRAGKLMSRLDVRKCAFLVASPLCDNREDRRYVRASAEANMPAIDEDDRPKKKIAHEIGQDLTLLSVGELTDRVALLKEEIARLEANMASKRAQKSAADQFFKK
jgi:uncharacterized small protein (DUF1192 family)